VRGQVLQHLAGFARQRKDAPPATQPRLVRLEDKRPEAQHLWFRHFGLRRVFENSSNELILLPSATRGSVTEKGELR
jgi:hypothetical protein